MAHRLYSLPNKTRRPGVSSGVVSSMMQPPPVYDVNDEERPWSESPPTGLLPSNVDRAYRAHSLVLDASLEAFIGAVRLRTAVD